jgi:broad specificity phosphatase PhoE
MRVLFITHPEVAVDPAVPVPRWRLADRGMARMRDFVASGAVADVDEVWSSTETKAIEAAGLLAVHLGLGVNVLEALGENDRSSTGYLPPQEFEIVADEFFAAPAASVRGWETALAAQTRISRAVRTIVAMHGKSGDLAIIGHGGVGALLMCELLGQRIGREHDQPHQGCFWTFDPHTWAVLQRWRPIAPR